MRPLAFHGVLGCSLGVGGGVADPCSPVLVDGIWLDIL